MTEEKKELNEQELEKANGGYGGGWWVSITHDNGTFVALRSAPSGSDSTIVYELKAGTSLFTYGETSPGSAVGGGTCTYLKAEFNGYWGWIHSGFVA